MVNGPSPGPAPAAQARANSSRLTRSSWRTWPHRKLRRKVLSVDGALTTQPMALAVPPLRNTSASAMQSPPARADATSVSILSPGLARPGVSPRSSWLSTSSLRPRWWAKVTGKSSPALATRRWSSKATWMGQGRCVLASVGCSSFRVGFLSQKPLSLKPGALSHPLST